MTSLDISRPALGAVAFGCVIAVIVWGRSSRRLLRACRRLRRELAVRGGREDALVVARSMFTKDLHTTILYGLLAASAATTAATGRALLALPFLLILGPVALSLRYARSFLQGARLVESRSLLERRAEEVLEQEELAPVRWSARLAPSTLPEMEGFELAQYYQPGSGAMAGDFYDVATVGPGRWAAVIGDVTGHGVEPSITAFQVKYLLRVFLREYRDPAQAVEELNKLLSAQAHHEGDNNGEELVSLCAVVFDQAAGALRFASAGHPPAWLWHEGEVRPLRATGPLLTLDPKGSYFSRELPLAAGDVLLLYTDGLTEARSGEQIFGDERVAAVLRRDAEGDLSALCKSLVEAARDFASEAVSDDVAILAARRR